MLAVDVGLERSSLASPKKPFLLVAVGGELGGMLTAESKSLAEQTDYLVTEKMPLDQNLVLPRFTM